MAARNMDEWCMRHPRKRASLFRRGHNGWSSSAPRYRASSSANLLTVPPLPRSLPPVSAEARLIDILYDHDGVVDHEPDRDGERHQRNGVDAEIEKVHRRKRAEQRQGNGDAGDHRCPNIAQEHENDHYDQANGERECEFHLAYSGADGLCAVEKRLHR